MPHHDLAITGLYTALLAILFLAGEVVIGRRDVDGLDLATRLRRRSEHVPFALLLMAVIEHDGSLPFLLHSMGLLLLAARAAAPLAGIARAPVNKLEQAGSYTTMAVTIVAALIVLGRFAAIAR